MKGIISLPKKSVIFLASALTCIAVLGHSTAFSQVPRIPLSKEQLIKLAKDSILGKSPELIVREWIEPNKIGFLPTAAIRKGLEEAGVPSSITKILPKHFASKLWLKIFEFDCFNCPPEANVGKELATMIRDKEQNLKVGLKTALGDMLHGKSFDPQIESLKEWATPIHKQPLVYVHGSLAKEGQTDKITALISYESITDSGPVGPNFEKSISTDRAAREQAASEIAEWLVSTLKSALE